MQFPGLSQLKMQKIRNLAVKYDFSLILGVFQNFRKILFKYIKQSNFISHEFFTTVQNLQSTVVLYNFFDILMNTWNSLIKFNLIKAKSLTWFVVRKKVILFPKSKLVKFSQGLPCQHSNYIHNLTIDWFTFGTNLYSNLSSH